MTSPAEIDQLMHRAWPGRENIGIDGWIARLAGGITSRANSVLPLRRPDDLEAALAAVEGLYRERDLTPTFQISPAAQPATLDALLAERGYARHSPTLVQTAAIDVLLQRLPPSEAAITITKTPDDRWMDCWWAVDGRGGSEARAIAERILLACPALYATLRDAPSVTAVGRLALVGDWGGIYCMAVRENVRRRGHGRAILRGLIEAAAREGIQDLWLQVVEGNHAARAFYEQAGFTDTSRYHYRSLMR